MKYQQIKQKRSDDTNALFTTLGVFWAFSNEQFKEGLSKTTLLPGEKLADIGAGGYMPRHNYDALVQGMKAIEKTFKQAIKDAKARTEHILYELNNHECFYTGNIESACEALGDDYKTSEVAEVYKEYKKGKYKQNLSINEV